jgi:hypothetical protein
VLELTTKGRGILDTLSDDHARELNVLAPQLIKALSDLTSSALRASGSSTGGTHES